VPELDPRIEAIVLKCLQKDKAQRYQSMMELKADLEAVLPGSAEAASGSQGQTSVGGDARLMESASQIRVGPGASGSQARAATLSPELEQSLVRAGTYLQRRTYLAALLEVRRILDKEAQNPQASRMRDEIYAAMEKRAV
jgi:hypothetical protein